MKTFAQRWLAAALAAAGSLISCAPAHQKKTVVETEQVRTSPPPPSPTGAATPARAPLPAAISHPTADVVYSVMASWPGVSRNAANELIGRNGLPDEVTPTLLIWRDRGDWKRTVVHRDLYDHDFPQPHQDVVEQVIDYRVPAEKIAELDQFDGSLSFNRTRGELTSWGQSEEENRLQLNLANDIVQNKLSVSDARDTLARSRELVLSGRAWPGQGTFWKNDGKTADPDAPAPVSGGGPAWP